MTAVEVQDKFRSLFETYGSRRQADTVIAAVESLDRLQDIGELFTRFCRKTPRRKSTGERLKRAA